MHKSDLKMVLIFRNKKEIIRLWVFHF